MEVDKVAVKTPPFDPSDPALWFTIIESSFFAAGISAETTKYHHCLGALDSATIREVRDIVLRPLGDTPYTRLKTEVTKRLSPSVEARNRRLLEAEDIGDRTPSQFLRHLQSLGGTAASEGLLKTLWTTRLPQAAQTVIAAQRGLSLDDLAPIADDIVETLQQLMPPPPIHQVTAAPPPVQPTTAASSSSSLEATLKHIISEIAELKRSNTEYRQQYRSRERSPSRSYNRRPSPHRPQFDNHDESNCYYHQRYGARAEKCRQPCRFMKGNANASQ